MALMEEELASEGWRLKKSTVEEHCETHKANSVQNIVKWALNQDLSEIGEKYIQEKISSSKENLLVGPCVLQVSKIRNVSAPKENEHSNTAPRMLKISLTDGSSTISGIEYSPIEQLSLKTPPGTKVKLTGSIVYTSGMLQLQPECVKVLGGKVEKLYTKWKIGCESGGLSRSGISTDGGPPPFVAFGKRVDDARYKKGTKSLAKSTNDNENEPSEFNEQRKAAIAETGKAGDDKNFSADARANFGRRPEMELSNKKPSFVPSPSSQFNTDADKTNNPQKAAGFYRELSTDSGQNVHQRTVNEFVEMGFKHKDVVSCMQMTNNNFDATMDLLVDMSNGDVNQRPSDRGRNQRGNPRGGRRGRGRGRSNYDEIDTEDSQSSNPATLFDFLESKMPTFSVSNKKHHQEPNEATKSAYARYDNREQARDVNRPGRGRGDSGRGRGDGGRGRGDRGRGDRGRWRGGPRHDNRRDHQTQNPQRYVRERNFGERQENRDFSNRNENPPRHQNTSRGSNREYESRNDHKKHDRGNQDDGRDRRSNPRTNDHTRDENGTRNSGNNMQTRTSRIDDRKSHEPSPSNNQRNDKAQHQQQKPATYKQGYDGRAPAQIKPQELTASGNPIPTFGDLRINPPPPREPTTFGQSASRNPAPDTTHSQPPPFKNQHSQPFQPPPTFNQQSQPGQPPSFNSQHNHHEQRVQIMLPQWQVGHECMAKYWEDSQFYRAIITDLHPSAPTAVVQFMDFGNYEEVQLFDLKSLHQSYGPNPMHGYPAPAHERDHGYQRNPRRQTKPPMALYVPPKNRGQA